MTNKDNFDYQNKDLRGYSFKGQKLSGVNFSNSDISGCDFSEATLTEANFKGVEVGISWSKFIILTIVGISFGSILGYQGYYYDSSSSDDSSEQYFDCIHQLVGLLFIEFLFLIGSIGTICENIQLSFGDISAVQGQNIPLFSIGVIFSSICLVMIIHKITTIVKNFSFFFCTSFRNADLTGAILDHTIIENADLTGAILDHTIIEEIDTS